MNSLIQQIQIGIDFIEANLDKDITLAQVASSAHISQWHFQRIFKALTNETLKAYIRSRRLSNALDQLLDSDIRIIDIAFDAGFKSQESFTRAFKKVYGMNPNAFRQIANKNLFLKKVRIDTEYLQNLEHNISREPEILLQPKLELIGLRTVFYSVDSEKNNIAEKLPPLWGAFLKCIMEFANEIPETCYGIIRPTAEKPDQLEYFAAVELKALKRIPADGEFGLTTLNIPEQTYAKFACRGLHTNLNDTVDYAYSSWLLQSEKRHTYGADIEIYGPEYDMESEDSTIYYAIPIR